MASVAVAVAAVASVVVTVAVVAVAAVVVSLQPDERHTSTFLIRRYPLWELC